MSSDLLEDLDADDNGAVILAEMKANGNVFFTVMDAADNSTFYLFTPDAAGTARAEKVIAVLQGWVEHVRERGE